MNDKSVYQNIIAIMRQVEADISPIKTRVIADRLGVTVYQARYRLEELARLRIVSRSVALRGAPTRWRLEV